MVVRSVTPERRWCRSAWSRAVLAVQESTRNACRVSTSGPTHVPWVQSHGPVTRRRCRGRGNAEETEPVGQPTYGPREDTIEVVPVVVVSQSFPARPSFIPEIRDFVRRCLADSPLDEEGEREVGETVFRALLQAAGPTGSVQVAFRLFPAPVAVDGLHSESHPAPGRGPIP